MRKYVVFSLAAVLAIVLAGGLVYAQSGHPSAKATAKVGDIAILEATEMEWATILSNTLKTPNQKDLFIDVSLECGLYTKTKVASQKGEKDTATAEAGVKVRVLLDGVAVHPAEVVFCRRTQELTAVFGGIMEQCEDINGDGIITQDECIWSDEELELVLDTMNANAFNFIEDDLGSGVHTIEVQAMIETAASSGKGAAEAWATIGNGSVTVEEVRMIKDEDIELP